MRSFLVALAFLTILPIRFPAMPTPETVARSRFWYPLVGLLVGVLLGSWTLAVTSIASPMASAFLVLVVWVVLSGSLHLDGFGDLCDGLFGGPTPEDRLRIMKDPHVGTFGAVGVFLLLLGKWVVLSDVLTRQADHAPVLIGAAAMVARSLTLCLAAGAHYPRPEGTGKVLIEATTWLDGSLAFCIAAGVILAIYPPPDPSNVLPLALVALVVLKLRMVCDARLGGITGDCLGAGIEGTELAFLLAAAIVR
ncbi:MAG: adenosylcobinamide-GDP ribazoletransferase [Gemmataceae bacterium]|nr:adenosylcobinamide-GDP ribazoletransferase [Gemmataceae bacterium]